MGISPGDLARLQQRLQGGRKRIPDPDGPSVRYSRVLGIDPSLRGTGFGVIEMVGRECREAASGTIRCPAVWPRSRCLGHIATTLRDVVRRHSPEVCAVEGLFFAQNLRTAITLGEARGAGLAVIAEAGLAIYELAPRQIKQSLVGFGGAQKLAVGRMVQRMLGLAQIPDPDAADALAVALAFANAQGRRIGGQGRKV